jgi:hypothetical protein
MKKLKRIGKQSKENENFETGSETNPMRMKISNRIGKQSGEMETFSSKWKTI